ncbi:MAG: BrnT family toxin [Lachnospiraceae bacterium]|jgi:uncharacterized DUF497 family protein|nr:BrnT family toxin [Lachnospiraceae bacterium]
MTFEWDIKKEQINLMKHGLDFSTSALVFGDENRIELYDYLHSTSEDRYITIGTIYDITIVVAVVYTERNNTIRIISSRRATKNEKEAYYEERY